MIKRIMQIATLATCVANVNNYNEWQICKDYNSQQRETYQEYSEKRGVGQDSDYNSRANTYFKYLQER